MPQIPRLCLSLNIYFQRINARGRQDLAPRQKGDTRNSNTGVQMHLCSFDRFQKALMHWCFRFWPPLCHLLCMTHSPLEAWSSVPSRYKTVRIVHQEVSLSLVRCWVKAVGLITNLLVAFLKGSRVMLWHVLVLMITLPCCPLCPPQLS